jgi:ABC-2 type transport system permease protein
MKGFMAVFGKEVYAFLASPIFYVCAFIFLGLSGYFFYSNTAIFAIASFQTMQNPYLAQQLNLSNMVITPTFGYMTIIMLILIPLMSMRLFSEEKRSGTVELLFTYPIRDMAVVMGKYLSTVFMFAIMVAGTLPFMFLLTYVGNPDWDMIGSAYIGIMLLAGAFISFGMFASSLTENQIISAVISFGGLFMFWIVEWATAFTEGWVNKVFDYLSIMSHFDNLSRGLIDSRDVTYYLLFIVFFLFCTLRYLDSKKWRA